MNQNSIKINIWSFLKPMKITKWEIIKIFIFIIISVNSGCKDMLSASKVKSAQLADKLYVYNWTNYIAKDTIPGFEKEYGVKIIYGNYSNNEELHIS